MKIRSRSGSAAPALVAAAAAVLLTAGVASQAGAWSYKEAAEPYVGVEINVLDEIQPLAYARGLARAAMEEGAVIHGASAATAIVRDGAGWSVRTERASVRGEFVVLATNGYTDDLWPGLRRSVVPVASFVTATAPLKPFDGAKRSIRRSTPRTASISPRVMGWR